MAITNRGLIEQYSSVHASKEYGHTSQLYWPQIQVCIIDLKPESILEYGCGQSNLIDILDYDAAKFHRYDPAIPEYSKVNVDRVDFIINTDVLEHIPAEDIDDVLKHMSSLSAHVFFNIALGLANEILPNGQNAHCTIWSAEKWLSKIRGYFPNATLCYSEENKICLIITWPSSVGRLVNEIQCYQIQTSAKNDHIFKKIERHIRTVRNKIIGKERYRKIKNKILS